VFTDVGTLVRHDGLWWGLFRLPIPRIHIARNYLSPKNQDEYIVAR
jgi:hypothetical protein